jgi:hypothetical protein
MIMIVKVICRDGPRFPPGNAGEAAAVGNWSKKYFFLIP